MAVAAFCERPPDGRGYAGVTRADLRPHAEDSPWMANYDALEAMWE